MVTNQISVSLRKNYARVVVFKLRMATGKSL